TIKNSMIAEELHLPPVKIHCSVLAEDAIKSAIADFRAKQQAKQALAGTAPASAGNASTAENTAAADAE
ncbi:MAG TPA: iron-sulfur cluster assembly scaffold protein, partial [Sorangium sp.]|nr:iron-sulfur cluster assembly scaffold protein [Sorangium sp.]